MPSEATQITAFNCCRVMPRRWVSASNPDVSGCPLDLPMANWNLGSPNYSHCSSFINAGPWCRVKASFQDASTGGKVELPIRFAQGYYQTWYDLTRDPRMQHTFPYPSSLVYVLRALRLLTQESAKTSLPGSLCHSSKKICFKKNLMFISTESQGSLIVYY